MFFAFAVLLSFATAVWQSCQKNKLEPLPFFEVFTRPFSGRLESVTLRGEIVGLEEGTLPDAVGFLYNTDLVALQSAEPTGNMLTAVLMPGGGFEARFENPTAAQNYYFRAFATIGRRKVYGDALTYRLGEIVVTGETVVQNDSAFLSGVFLGLQITGDTITEYGHVLSVTNRLPERGAADCTTLPQYDIVSADRPFASKAGNLALNTTYYLRAYAKGKKTTFYSPAQIFHTEDGWKQMASIDSLQDAIGAAGNGAGYIGFGCDARTNCLQNSLPADFWKFTPDPSGGSWSKTKSIPTVYLRNKVASFVIGDTIYYAGGEYFDAFCTDKPCYVFDFLKFDTKTQSWLPGDSDTIPTRSGAVAFSLNGKGYIGAGETEIGNHIVSLNDFWEYNPKTGKWRKVASLPLRQTPSDSVTHIKGRAEAAAFSIDNFAYVGAGRLGFLPLNDFWRFRAPAHVLDTGTWEQIPYFRGLGRSGAVSFQIKSKGYVGLGFNLTHGNLKDLWEYDPVQNEWFARTSFPAGRRRDAVGFAIGTYGYAGTGFSRSIETGTDLEVNYVIHGDLWRYEPR